MKGIIYRRGKTANDRSKGAHGRNAGNKAVRADWQKLSNNVRHNGHKGIGAFPYKTCNGKRNRSIKRSLGISS